MATIQAFQHIYTHVEPEQSPRRQGGFQTLLYTRAGLTEAEVEEMEVRLLYFPGVSEPVKRVFFPLTGGKVVVGQIVSLPEPDRLGRKGRYLAHSLVLDGEEFNRQGADPFLIWKCCGWITTVDEALAQGDRQSGDMPPAALEVPERAEGMESARGWPIPELKRLTLLALRAQQLAASRTTLLCVGEPAQVESALHAALLAVPSSLRARCSFDTYFYRCNMAVTYYWAVGLAEPITRPNTVTVDTRARLVRGSVDEGPRTAYERWLAGLFDSGGVDQAIRYRDAAYALAEWLEGRPYDEALLEQIPSEVSSSLLSANSELVLERLHARLEEQLAPVLAARVFEPIARRPNAQEMLRWLREGTDLPILLDTLYELYENAKFHPPSRDEERALGALLQRVEHSGLVLLYACWSGQRQTFRARLAQLDEEQYRRFVHRALRTNLVRPFELLVSERAEIFLGIYLATDLVEKDGLVPLARALIEAHVAPLLERLVPRLAKCPARERQALEKLIRGQPGVPASFREAVREK